MKVRIETLANEDSKGRPIICVVNTNESLNLVSKKLHKPCLLDKNGRISKILRSGYWARLYILSPDYKVLSAETGNKRTDFKNGFEKI